MTCTGHLLILWQQPFYRIVTNKLFVNEESRNMIRNVQFRQKSRRKNTFVGLFYNLFWFDVCVPIKHIFHRTKLSLVPWYTLVLKLSGQLWKCWLWKIYVKSFYLYVHNSFISIIVKKESCSIHIWMYYLIYHIAPFNFNCSQ